MRIPYPHIALADRCLRICRRLLDENIHNDQGKRFPKERGRNALCRGLGYGSYTELGRFKTVKADGSGQIVSDTDVREALAKGFSLALAEAHALGFRFDGPAKVLAARLAVEAV